LGAEFAKQNQQRNNRKWIPEGSKKVKKLLGMGRAGLAWAGRWGHWRALTLSNQSRPEKPPIPHFHSGSFGAIFDHFGIILKFFFEAVFQQGFGTVFQDFDILFDFILTSFSDHFCVCICIPRKRDFEDPYKGNQWFCLLECGPKYDKIGSKIKSKNNVKKNSKMMRKDPEKEGTNDAKIMKKRSRNHVEKQLGTKTQKIMPI